jgi:branched-chain amino acid transport system permease protein
VFLLLGLGAGAVYAALALGLVLVHRVSGVVNFAHGAMASAAAYAFVAARDAGTAFAAAFALALAFAAALGLAAYVVVFRPLRAAPALARVVASVGLMVTIQAAIVLRFGSDNRPVAAILPAEPVTIAGLVVPRDRLGLAALVVAAAAALWLAYRRTRFGLASRAAADNPDATALLGWSPDALAAANWVVASVLAALAGILAAPITTLNPATYTLLVVPALAAALAGGLASFGGTVAAAFAIGMAQSAMVKLQADVGWLPRVGVREGLPLLVVVVAMAVRGRALARAERTGQRAAHARLPAAGRPRRPLVATLVATTATAAALFAVGGQYRLALIQSLIGAVVCLSLVVLTGYLGQISLAQMAFAGVAGFALSRLALDAGWGFPLAPLAAAALAASAGLVLAVPAVRARGVNLAVVTLAGAVAVEELVFKNPALTEGFGSSPVPPPALGTLDLSIGGPGAAGYPRAAFGLVVLAVVAALALACAGLRAGRFGRRLLAVRSNERAAAAAGVGVTGTKLVGFALSAFVAGLGGALLGYSQGQVSFASFGVFVSLSFLAVAYLGGIARISGALVGGALVAGGIAFTVLEEVAGLGRYHLLASGVGLVVMAVLSPDGLSAAAGRLRERLR